MRFRDLANDLRLRQIDLLGRSTNRGAAIALEPCRGAAGTCTRRLVLIEFPTADRSAEVAQPILVMRTRTRKRPQALAKLKAVVPNARFEDIAGPTPGDLFDAEPKALAKHIGAFLSGRP